MRALIIEDDSVKMRRLAQVLIKGGVEAGNISEATSAHQAKTLMRATRFDLVLLDLNIPKRAFEEPVAGEGVRLLEEIVERPKFNKPAHVIGVTAFDGELVIAQPKFDAALIPIFLYESESDGWEFPLQRRVEYLLATMEPIAQDDDARYDYDLAVITALERPELSAVLDLPWNWAPTFFADDDTTYHCGNLEGRERNLRVVAAHSPFMGMPAASVTATKMIQRFRPRYLAHVGIAAAVRGQAEIGDVLIADPSWDWGSGKFVLEGEEVVFYAAPYQIALREEMRGLVRRLAAEEAVLANVRSEWKGTKPPTVLSVRLGPVASGASVLADGHVKDRIRDQHRKVIGIEMETYGVLAATEFAGKPRPIAISMKSACDFADGEKNDQYQPYAAYTSAKVLEVLAGRYL